MLGGTTILAAATGCGTNYIPNTDVPDNEENRSIIAFCELYRKAVERKDVNLMLKMTSPDYYEDGGNPDASDDMDFVQFKKWLTGEAVDETGLSFQDAMAIRHEIRYRRVIQDDKRIFVDYTYSASFKVPTSHGDQWKRKVEDNRLELVVDDAGEFKVIAGM
ncbi:MAG: hypothetical protein HOW73_16390 [Polyangiaceae bacterium]|nr:hypothetical protein [Polyangiaceae bacterium]